MFVRLTKTVRDKGNLVAPEEVDGLIDDRTIDWYYSPFYYGEDAKDYFEEHDRSIKGYTGDAWTNTLYWDLDCKEDFEKVRESAKLLVRFLEDNGYGDGIEVYFSGNKGVHVFLHTENKFTPAQTKQICYNVAVEAGVSHDVFDTSVYNVNRIFRVPLTKHQSSGLYKIPLEPEAVDSMSEEDIRKLAKKPIDFEYEIAEVDAQDLLDQFGQIKEIKVNNVVDMEEVRKLYGSDFNPMDCPPDKRRCIYVLENGYFGSGERENATIRLAAYYNAHDKSREEARDLILTSLRNRSLNYPDLNPWNESDVDRNLDQVYSDNWNGGAYSCKTDHYLASKCDVGGGCCADEKQTEKLNVRTIGGLIADYKDYANQALLEYPKTGIEWLDTKVRLRPKNFSIINGANGSGKTSIALQIMENLNKQEMYHMFFSLDMANTSLFEKLGARYTNYSQRDIEAIFNPHTRDEEKMAEIAEVVAEKMPYTIFDFTSSCTSEHIEHTLATLKRRKIQPVDIQLAFVDYAGRVTSDGDSDFANATKIALAANDIAKRTNTHIVYISQVPRDEGDHTKPLRSSRVAKNSGAWEENATIVINCWRPFGDGIQRLDRFFHLYIAKNRSGELGERVFNWEGKTGSIFPMDKIEFDDYFQLCEQHKKPEPYPQFGSDDELIGRDMPKTNMPKGKWNNDKKKGLSFKKNDAESKADGSVVKDENGVKKFEKKPLKLANKKNKDSDGKDKLRDSGKSGRGTKFNNVSKGES